MQRHRELNVNYERVHSNEMILYTRGNNLFSLLTNFVLPEVKFLKQQNPKLEKIPTGKQTRDNAQIKIAK